MSIMNPFLQNLRGNNTFPMQPNPFTRPRNPMYRAEGGDIIEDPLDTSTTTTPGAPTIPPLPGVDAHETLNETITSTGPVITEGMTPEEITNAYITWASDPNNIPDYYGGATVAEFDQAELDAFAQKEALAAEQDALNKQRLSQYQDWLDPNSQAQQYAQNQAAQKAAGAAFGAGTPGSARGQYASAAAAQAAQHGLTQDALAGIEGVQGDLTKGADLLADVGSQRREYVQNVINEDIKRWNFAQLAPQEQWDKLLGLANQLKAMELGNVSGDGGGGGDDWKSILANVVGSSIGDTGGILESILGFLNQGGPVVDYKQGGGILGGPQAGPPAAAPMGPPPGGIIGAKPPMTPPGAGIMGTPPSAPSAPPMEKPMGGEMMQMSMMTSEPTSEIDKAEGILQGLAAASGGTLTIKRKSKGGK